MDGNNHLTGSPYQYDAAGNMIHDASHSYTYDAENRLTQVDGGATASYVYDALGRRIQKTAGGTTLDQIYAPNGNLVAEVNSGGLVYLYIYQGTQLLAEYENGTTYFVDADHLGSTRLVTGYPTPSIVECDDYYPFGEQTSCGGTWTTSHKFTGKERDPESGLDNFGARYDASSLGRFMSPDPLMASAHVGDPQSWNRYTYALNNPLRFVDPNGMDPGCGSGDDSKCKVTIRVNVIYDKNANGGKGLTDQQKKDFQNKTLGKATTDLGKSGIGLQVTYTAGSLSVDDGKATITGLQSNSLNLLVSSSLPTGNAGESGLNNGVYMSMVGTDDAHNANVFPLFTNTVEHEFTHQLKGDTQNPNSNPFSYILNEFNVDFRDQMMGWGVRQNSLVSGAQNKPFTVQPKQENIRPRTDQ